MMIRNDGHVMGHLVVDSNSFDYPDLTEFLKQSPRNRVVISPTVLKEAFHGDPLKNLASKFLPLERYVDRVVFVKNMHDLLKMHGKPKGLRKRLIDSKMTSRFVSLISKIKDAQENMPGAIAFIEKFGLQAADTGDRAEIAVSIRRSMKAIATDFSKQDIEKFRSGRSPSQKFTDRYYEHIALVTIDIFQQHRIPVPEGHQILNTFALRLALFYEVLVLDGVWHGSQRAESEKRLLNDLADTEILAVATFFDGIATKDQQMRNRFRTGNTILRHLLSLR